MDPEGAGADGERYAGPARDGQQDYDVATEGAFIGGPVIAMGVVALMSLVLMATINFGFGGKAKFADIFAVSYYAWLPEIFRAILGTIVILFGRGAGIVQHQELCTHESGRLSRSRGDE